MLFHLLWLVHHFFDFLLDLSLLYRNLDRLFSLLRRLSLWLCLGLSKRVAGGLNLLCFFYILLNLLGFSSLVDFRLC